MPNLDQSAEAHTVQSGEYSYNSISPASACRCECTTLSSAQEGEQLCHAERAQRSPNRVAGGGSTVLTCVRHAVRWAIKKSPTMIFRPSTLEIAKFCNPETQPLHRTLCSQDPGHPSPILSVESAPKVAPVRALHCFTRQKPGKKLGHPGPEKYETETLTPI